MAKKIKPSMRDEAVQKATGKTWSQWFRILDRFPKDKTHTERAAWLYQKHLKKGWWCQMVTVTYEQARGLRGKHQVVGGYQVSASKTLPIPVRQLYSWWTNSSKRKRWLQSKFTVTTATPNKSVRIRWPDGTRVDVGFYAQGPKKSSVQLQHEKLPNAKVAKRQQVWWRNQLGLLANLVT